MEGERLIFLLCLSGIYFFAGVSLAMDKKLKTAERKRAWLCEKCNRCGYKRHIKCLILIEMHHFKLPSSIYSTHMKVVVVSSSLHEGKYTNPMEIFLPGRLTTTIKEKIHRRQRKNFLQFLKQNVFINSPHCDV